MDYTIISYLLVAGDDDALIMVFGYELKRNLLVTTASILTLSPPFAFLQTRRGFFSLTTFPVSW